MNRIIIVGVIESNELDDKNLRASVISVVKKILIIYDFSPVNGY